MNVNCLIQTFNYSSVNLDDYIQPYNVTHATQKSVFLRKYLKRPQARQYGEKKEKGNERERC